MTVQFDNIPEPLRCLDQWVLWRYEERDGKQTKVPRTRHGGFAKSNDPSTWASFTEVRTAYERGGYDGVGLCLAPGDGIVGIDLDKCLGEDGLISDEALAILDQFSGTYIETSPSGKGFRIFGYGSPLRCGKGQGPHKWVEVYDHTSPRYLTVTGRVLLSAGERPLHNCDDALQWLHDRFMKREEKQRPQRARPAVTLQLSDQELLDRARAARNGAEFSRLYDSGSTGDPSSDDMALCNMLAFWCGCDARQMDRMFRASALMRDKWDSPRQGSTYGKNTLAKAIADCREVYEPRPQRQFVHAEGGPGMPESDHPQLPPPGSDEWEDGLVWKYYKDGTRKPKSVGVNAAKILAHDERIAGCLAYDELREDLACITPPPWNQEPLASELGATEIGAPWLDDDYTRLRCWIEVAWGITLGKDAVIEVALMAARRNRVHPVRDYLSQLEWDGTPRIGSWLVDYLGGKSNPEYLSVVGSKWLISAVARIMQPGCKADHVLILEGAQGAGKSSALCCLATVGRGSWFSDTPIHISTKDSYLALRGQWIVELAELDSVIRAENSEAKAFFSSAVDRYRPPYLRTVQDFPRQCVFAGSVNHDEYLRDETGGRRYWPVECGDIDLAGLTEHRDQLWAEAVKLYRDRRPWWPETPEEKALCQSVQSARAIEDPWLPIVLDFLNATTRQSLTSQEILTDACRLPTERVGRKEQMRLSRIMAQIDGWKSGRFPHAGKKVRGYILDQPPVGR